jgi:hypothetical protein
VFIVRNVHDLCLCLYSVIQELAEWRDGREGLGMTLPYRGSKTEGESSLFPWKLNFVTVQ